MRNKYEAGLVPEPIWAFWRIEESLALTEIRTPGRQTSSQVVIPTKLPSDPD